MSFGEPEQRASERKVLVAAPVWLRDLGFSSWLLVGFVLVIVGLVWLLNETATIALPVVVAGVLGALQQVIQPFVMGATLSLNPLVVLVVTIGAGALFGMVGLTLAAPLTSAAVHISNELRGRGDAAAGDVVAPEPSG